MIPHARKIQYIEERREGSEEEGRSIYAYWLLSEARDWPRIAHDETRRSHEERKEEFDVCAKACPTAVITDSTRIYALHQD